MGFVVRPREISVLLLCILSSAAHAADVPTVKVFPTDEQTLHTQYRRVIVGPGVNEPDPYPGYTGFVGWQGVTRTKTGALLLTFSSGYWHGSPPTPLGEREKGMLKKYGIAEVDAPRGAGARDAVRRRRPHLG
jgi:hypothetical protein